MTSEARGWRVPRVRPLRFKFRSAYTASGMELVLLVVNIFVLNHLTLLTSRSYPLTTMEQIIVLRRQLKMSVGGERVPNTPHPPTHTSLFTASRLIEPSKVSRSKGRKEISFHRLKADLMTVSSM